MVEKEWRKWAVLTIALVFLACWFVAIVNLENHRLRREYQQDLGDLRDKLSQIQDALLPYGLYLRLKGPCSDAPWIVEELGTGEICHLRQELNFTQIELNSREDELSELRGEASETSFYASLIYYFLMHNSTMIRTDSGQERLLRCLYDDWLEYDVAVPRTMFDAMLNISSWHEWVEVFGGAE